MIVDLASAASLLREGEPVAYPTETVYGLGADAGSAEAIAAVAALKGRAPGHAMSVLVPDLEFLVRCAPALPPRARALARHYWPGPLTLVVQVADPGLAVLASELGVGFRCSSHPTATALVRAAGLPVLATSCNKSGEPPCHSAEQVRACFGTELPIAGGEPAGGEAPSTVVAVDPAGQLKLLRQGTLAFREIEERAL